MSNNKLVLEKVALTGAAGWYLAWQMGFGKHSVRLGLGAAALMGTSYLVTGRVNQDSWIRPKQSLPKNWEAIKQRVSNLAWSQVFWGALILFGGHIVNQNAIHHMRRAFSQGPLEAVKAVGSVCIFGPVAEEIVFRGFVQERIEDVQIHMRGGAPDLEGEKNTRILLQALLFGLAHYSRPQGSSNPFIILATASMGYAFGRLKEDHGIHASMMYHAAANSLITARVFIAGG